jgi:hypothetical protein
LAAFDMSSGERFAYSRQVENNILTFGSGGPGVVSDSQTKSVWALREGRAISGALAGRTLSPALYSDEEIFPYRGVVPETNIFLSVWERFDTNWFLKIAQRGYASDDGSTVYLPMYPALIRMIAPNVGNTMLAALLISNLAAFGALILLFRLGESLLDTDSARRMVVYLLIFPTGFILLAAYTESLFLFFALGLYDFARRDKWFLATLFGTLAALTRLQGVLLILPLAYIFYRRMRMAEPATGRPFCLSRLALFMLIPFGTLIFLALTNLSLLGSYVGELHARFVFPWDNFLAMVALFGAGQASVVDGLNLISAVGFGALLVSIWRSLPREYGLYALVMFLAPLFRMTTMQPLVSMDRYVLVLFPAFILMGTWGKNPWINRAIVYLSFPVQLYLLAQFVQWGWVG